MIDRMDLSSKDTLTNFVESLGIQMKMDSQQGSLSTLMREMWKTLYSNSLLMQERASASSRKGKLPKTLGVPCCGMCHMLRTLIPVNCGMKLCTSVPYPKICSYPAYCLVWLRNVGKEALVRLILIRLF